MGQPDGKPWKSDSEREWISHDDLPAYNFSMSDEEALLSAIAANPAEDTPRLVYADWLDEHDHHIRAEFIRLQIDIAGKQEQETLSWRFLRMQYPTLVERHDELIAKHRDELLSSLAVLPPNTKIGFERGFASGITLTVHDFLTHAPALGTAMPAVSVEVSLVGARLLDFLNSIFLGCVTGISLFDSWFVENRLAGPWPLPLGSFGEINLLSRLESLDLSGCGVGDGDMGLFRDWPIPSVTKLNLANNAITDTGITLFMNSSWPRTLRELHLNRNPIGDLGAMGLVLHWPVDSPIDSLTMRNTNIGPRGRDVLLARFGRKVYLDFE